MFAFLYSIKLNENLKTRVFGLHKVFNCPEIFSPKINNPASASNPFSGRRKEKLIFQLGWVAIADGLVSTGEEKKEKPDSQR